MRRFKHEQLLCICRYTWAELHILKSPQAPIFYTNVLFDPQSTTLGQSTLCLVPHCPFFISIPSFRFSASESAITVQTFANPLIQARTFPA